MLPFPKKFRWPLFFFFLALAVRLPLLGRMDFANFPEFYRDYFVTEKILSGRLPLLGPPSMQANFYFGPIYYYMFVPLFWLSGGHPASLLLSGILLYAVSAAFAYKLFLAWFKDHTVAGFGAAFYAISIYGIQLNSYVSNPNFLPLWVILFFYFLTKILEDKAKGVDYFFLGLAYSMAAQLHTTAALILPLAAVWPALKTFSSFRPRLPKMLYPAGLFSLGLLLPALPYLYFEVTTRFNNLRSLLAFGSQTLQGKHVSFGLQAILAHFRSSLDPFFMDNGYSFIQPIRLYWLVAAGVLIVIFCLLLAVKKGKMSLQKKGPILSSLSKRLCLSWLLSAAAVILLFNKSPHSHYLIIFWPLPVILLTSVFALAKQHLGIYKSLVFLVCLISALQAFALFIRKSEPWDGFYPVYEQYYKYSPQTPEIGAKTVGWPQPQQTLIRD